jgi:pimeloyl-ACP methyl ester carboxylesterase
VAYEVRGRGRPAIVFVHGWSCDRTYWKFQLEALAPRFQVVAIDLAGHGESGTGRPAWTMEAFGRDVVSVIEQLGLEEVVLVGHSMGGDIIVEAALRLPDAVSGLVWVDTYMTLGTPRTREQIDGLVDLVRKDFAGGVRELVGRMFLPGSDPELREWVSDDMSSAEPEIGIDVLRHAISNEPALLARLAELRTPLVAINGDYQPTEVASLKRHGVRTVHLPGAGHFLMLEDPEAFNRLLRETIRTFES